MGHRRDQTRSPVPMLPYRLTVLSYGLSENGSVRSDRSAAHCCQWTYVRSESEGRLSPPTRPRLNPRIACPRELPSSGSFLGPNKSKAITSTARTFGTLRSSRKNIAANLLKYAAILAQG